MSGAPFPLGRFVTRIGWLRVSPQGDLLSLGNSGSHEDILVLKTDETGVCRLADRSYHNRLSSLSPNVATARSSKSLKGDSRRTIEVFGIAPDDRSLFVS